MEKYKIIKKYKKKCTVKIIKGEYQRWYIEEKYTVNGEVVSCTLFPCTSKEKAKEIFNKKIGWEY